MKEGLGWVFNATMARKITQLSPSLTPTRHAIRGSHMPAARLVGDEPERREVLVLGGLGLDPDRVPGQLLEVEHLSLVRVLDPGHPQVRLGPRGALGLEDDAGHLQEEIKRYRKRNWRGRVIAWLGTPFLLNLRS